MTINQIKSCGIPSNTILVGNSHVLNELAKTVGRVFKGLELALDIGTQSPATLIFGRDLRITLWDGTVLIPSPFFSSIIKGNSLLAILPSSLRHLLKEFPDIIGLGLDPESQKITLQEAELSQTPFRIGKSSLEGGNCRLFLSSSGEKKAIIGELSVFLSYLSLKDQGLLEEKPLMDGPPSDDSIRAVRALNENIEDEEAILASHLKPLSEEERIHWHEEALAFESDLLYTKKLIALDLEMEEENIAFIPQEDFHIDLKLFVTEDGTVFYHDEKLAQELLQEQGITDYLLDPEKLAVNQKVLREIEKIIPSIGSRLERVPGAFSSLSKKLTINFMNGFSLSQDRKNFFITNGCRLSAVAAIFKRTIESTSNTQVLFVSENKDFLPKVLARNQGGLNCLTCPRKRELPPQPESPQNSIAQEIQETI